MTDVFCCLPFINLKRLNLKKMIAESKDKKCQNRINLQTKCDLNWIREGPGNSTSYKRFPQDSLREISLTEVQHPVIFVQTYFSITVSGFICLVCLLFLLLVLDYLCLLSYFSGS